MSIEITSTTDSNEAVTAALGGLAQQQETGEGEKQSVSGAEQSQEENLEASETSENEEADTEGEESEEQESEEDQSEKSEKKKVKSKSGFKRRIDKLNSKLSAKEQEAEYWKQEALKHQKKDATVPVEEKIDLKKPKAEDFESHEEFVEALTDYKLEQKEQQKIAESKNAQVKSEFQAQFNSHLERVEKFAKSHSDFEDVIEEASDIVVPGVLQEAIISSENGPELLYELAKNKEEFARICKLNPNAAARELGKFEAKIAKQSASAQIVPKTSKAPAPIKPVGGKSAGPLTKSPDDMSYQEFKKWREREAGA